MDTFPVFYSLSEHSSACGFGVKIDGYCNGSDDLPSSVMTLIDSASQTSEDTPTGAQELLPTREGRLLDN